MAPNYLPPTLAMLAAVFLWSSATPGSKFALREIGVAEFVVIRLSLAAIALWLIVLVTRTSAHLRHVGWHPLVIGLLDPGLVTFLVSVGLSMTPAVSGSVFFQRGPAHEVAPNSTDHQPTRHRQRSAIDPQRLVAR